MTWKPPHREEQAMSALCTSLGVAIHDGLQEDGYQPDVAIAALIVAVILSIRDVPVEGRESRIAKVCETIATGVRNWPEGPEEPPRTRESR